MVGLTPDAPLGSEGDQGIRVGSQVGVGDGVGVGLGRGGTEAGRGRDGGGTGAETGGFPATQAAGGRRPRAARGSARGSGHTTLPRWTHLSAVPQWTHHFGLASRHQSAVDTPFRPVASCMEPQRHDERRLGRVRSCVSSAFLAPSSKGQPPVGRPPRALAGTPSKVMCTGWIRPAASKVRRSMQTTRWLASVSPSGRRW